MNSRSAIHQKSTHASRARSSSSQARTLLHGWTPETEIEREEPDSFSGPPLSGFTRGLPNRNRAPSGGGRRRPPDSSSAGGAQHDVASSRNRKPSLVEKLRAATAGRRPSESSSPSSTAVVHGQGSRKRVPSVVGSGAAAAAGGRRSSYDNNRLNSEVARKRGPSLVAKARELINQQPPKTETSSRRPPNQRSRYDESASESEKVRLSIEAETPCFNLVQRWKDPNDWLQPSRYWKKTHPAMNFRLWRIIVRNPQNGLKLKASAERDLGEASRLYEAKGGDGGEWWPVDLEEEILDSWSLSFGGHDPPRYRWTLEE